MSSDIQTTVLVHQNFESSSADQHGETSRAFPAVSECRSARLKILASL